MNQEALAHWGAVAPKVNLKKNENRNWKTKDSAPNDRKHSMTAICP